MSQPKWQTLWATDYSKLRVDKTGKYSPELDLYEDWREFLDEDTQPMPDGGWWERATIVLDRCWNENGVLSDNIFHLDYPAWFASDLNRAANSVGMEYEYLVDLFCNDDPSNLAWAYDCLTGYWGRHEFDSYPVHFTDEEMQAAEYGLA